MKKVLLSLTLFMASFFFVTLNKVNAMEYDLEFNVNDLQLINDSFFEYKEKVVNFLSENNLSDFIILYSQNRYKAIAIDNDCILKFNTQYIKAGVWYLYLVASNCSAMSYSDSSNIEFTNTSYSENLAILANNSSYISRFVYSSNFLLSTSEIGSHVYNLNFQDKIYIYNSSQVYSLYDIYLDFNKPEEEPALPDKFTEEKEILNNFYSTIFTKITDLANNFANNYIFLLILGIFILIFVFELIWRRFI